MESPESERRFLKAHIWEERSSFRSDQQKGLPPPPAQKPYPPEARLIDLVAPADISVGRMPLIEAIGRRSSKRQYSAEALTLEELSFLAWATQGVRQVLQSGVLLRTVPSAGARHAFETYLAILRVQSVEPGLYRYLSVEHKLCFLYADPKLPDRLIEGTYAQRFVGQAAVVFIWTVIPYRMEWRYGSISPKIIALDAGHVCQNLYLAAEAIGAGACAIAAYHQAKMDAILGVDGQEEFTVYLAPVGKAPARP